jgi:membrane protein involved in colicin uptake
MTLWLLLLAAIVVGGAYWVLTRKDSNETAKAIADEVTEKLDVNNDGKVNVEDAKVAVEVVKTKTRAAASKAKTTAKKAVSKAPTAKKSVAKTTTTTKKK